MVKTLSTVMLLLPVLASAQANMAHMHDDPLAWKLEVEELEWRQDGGREDLHWDVVGWLGHDANRLWLRSEGEREPGATAENQFELLWGHAIAPWWDSMLGLRVDSGALPTRVYAAFGVQGEAPQFVHVEATAYLGDRLDAGLRLQADYDLLLTQRLVLAARAEAELWTDADEREGRGAAASQASVGLRLRYEFLRELAPYAGLEWARALGDSADLARDDREPVQELRWVAGLRFWF